VSNERIVLAHREPIFRRGTRLILERDGFEVVAEVTTGTEASEAVKRLEPDVLVIGALVEECSAIDVARELRSSGSRTRTILLTEGNIRLTLADIVAAGFLGCVESSHDAGVLISAIRDVLNGAAVYWCAGKGEEGTGGKVELSPREQQVLQLLAGGLSKKAISDKLGISIRTVEAHRTSVMAKLNIHTIAGLVHFAVRTGVIDP
jgi:DNA-binding NarL/FixJ family response regulator